jgi:hypothetical protein
MPDRAYQIGNTALAFEHTALKESGIELKESGLIVQALTPLGQEQILLRLSRRYEHGCRNRYAPDGLLRRHKPSSHPIKAYASQVFPEAFSSPDFEVVAYCARPPLYLTKLTGHILWFWVW